MATKTTGWSCTHSASVISQTNSTATIRVTSYWTNSGWNYDIGGVSAWVHCGGSSQQVKSSGAVYAPSNHASYSMGYYDFVISKGTSTKNVSCYATITSNSSYVSGTKSSSASSVSISALPSYTVSYNANSGSGTPSSQTKWYKQNLTLSSTRPTRTGYSFAGWATSASGSVVYQPGGTYADNADIVLYAVWKANTYTVTYNANGGTGAPANQTKTYGVNLNLTTSVPTRTDYNFLGWATSANGGVVYEVGATYTNNSAVTLYAVWELAYVKPRLTAFLAQRCDSSGITNEDGTYVIVTFDWVTDFDVTDIQIEWKTQIGNTWSTFAVTVSGTSGSVSQVVGDGLIDNETSYIFRAYVSDRDTDGTTYSPQISIGTIKYPIDVKNGGTGVAFGKVAEEDDIADFAFTVKLGGGLSPIFLEAETDLNDVKTPNFYTGENITRYNYTNCPLLSGTFYLEVVSMGGQGQLRQRISSCSKANSLTFERTYYEDSWGEWRNCYVGEEVVYDNEAGSAETITMSQAASQFQYLEIYFMDNTDEGEGYVKIYKPNGKTVDLSLTEGSTATMTYFRRTSYTISGVTITPDTTNAGYVRISNATANHVGGTNYLKITRVVGKR